jgi:hypothetical protein
MSFFLFNTCVSSFTCGQFLFSTEKGLDEHKLNALFRGQHAWNIKKVLKNHKVHQNS